MSETVDDDRSLKRYDDELERFGRGLADIRRRHGMRVSDVALNTGLSSAGLSRLERCERTPTLRTLLALSDVFRVRLVIEGGQIRTEPLL